MGGAITQKLFMGEQSVKGDFKRKNFGVLEN